MIQFYLLILLLVTSSCTWSENKTATAPSTSLSNLLVYLVKSPLDFTKDSKMKIKDKGFTILDERNYIRIKNNKGLSKGHGNYWISKKKNAHPIFLQAPHSFHDAKTGKIIRKILKVQNILVGMTNDLHRYKKRVASESVKADLAHRSDSSFFELSNSLAKSNAVKAVVQLHGYSSQKRKSKQAKYNDIILSNGSSRPSAIVNHIDSCLKSKEIKSIVYGKDVYELGGTKNIFIQRGHSSLKDKFVHIEMSERIRRKLTTSDKTLRGLVDCLSF